jgi:hypothetical protein
MEHVNQELEQYLRIFVNHCQNDWVQWLSIAEFAHNNRIHSATKFSPFMVNYGQNPCMGHEAHASTKVAFVENLVDRIKRIGKEAEEALKRATVDMKKFYDRKRGRTPIYVIGDKVWLDATNISTDRQTKKLDHKHLGPFTVEEVLLNNTYKLKLPSSMKIHPVFHVVKLITFKADEIPERISPPIPDPIIVDDHEEYEVEEILDSRRFRGCIQYLVKWKNYPSEANSWEPAQTIREDIPLLVKHFHDTHPDAIRILSNPIILDPELFSHLPFIPLPEKNLHVVRTSPDAQIPTRGSTEATGLDLYSAECVIVPAKGRALVNLGLAMAVPYRS